MTATGQPATAWANAGLSAATEHDGDSRAADGEPSRRRMVLTYVASGAVLLGLVAPGTAVHTFAGDQAGERFGWAVSELSDIDRDGVREAVVGAPRHRNAAGQVVGHADVYSGRTGRLIYRFEGEPDDRLGYAMADAGDVDGDRVADIVVGATGEGALQPAPRSRAPAGSTCTPARTGRRLLRVDGQDGRRPVRGGGRRDRRRQPRRPGRSGGGRALPRRARRGRMPGRPTSSPGATAGSCAATTVRRPATVCGWGAAGLGDIDRDRRGDYVVGAKDAGTGRPRPGLRLLRTLRSAAVHPRR